MRSETLLERYPLISDQVDRRELSIILGLLEGQLNHGVQGSVVEFGCYIGTTSLFIRRLLDAYGSENAFHVYDSFEGLPEKTALDDSPAGLQFRPGELSVSRKTFAMQFKKAGLKPPVVHKDWFHNLQPDNVPDNITFAFLDGDYYESVLTPLQLIWPKLTPGAIVIVDDYANEALPGAAKAVNEWLTTHPARLRVEHSLAVIST